MNFKGKDLSGKTFGRLTVIGLHGFRKYHVKRKRWMVWQRYPMWLCECECGNTIIVMGQALISKNTQSCGCLHSELLSLARTTHGQSTTSLYRRWGAMWTRCTNPNRDFWHCYGGRGIGVCKRWETFENFLKDMGPSFKPNLLLERRDNDSDYSPENCYWATPLQQANNCRTNKRVTAFGKTMTVAQWARELKISPFTLYDRLRRGVPSAIAFKT